MLMAMFSAVGGLLAGMSGNEAIIERQIQLSELMRLNRMELRSEVLLTRLAVLQSQGGEPEAALLEKIRLATAEAGQHAAQATGNVDDSKAAWQTHELFAISTTILSSANTLIGMAVIVQQRRVWIAGIGIGSMGAVLLLFQVMKMIVES